MVMTSLTVDSKNISYDTTISDDYDYLMKIFGYVPEMDSDG